MKVKYLLLILGVLYYSFGAGASLGDLVWYDVNRNNIQDIGEPGMPSIRLILYNSDTNYPLDTTYTDANGNYAFTSVALGNYYIVASLMPYGYIFSLANIGSDDNRDNDACPMGRSTLFSIVSDIDDYSHDFGLVVDTVLCSLTEIVCAEAYPSLTMICMDQYLGIDDSIASVSEGNHGISTIVNAACFEYAQFPFVADSIIDSLSVMICNSYGQCHNVCLFISQACVISSPAQFPCNDTIFTCLATYPSSMQLCVPQCLVSDGDYITGGFSTFHCSVVIETSDCVLYTSFPGMPLGYMDTVTVTFCNLLGHCHDIKYFIQVGCFTDDELAPQWLDPIDNFPVITLFFEDTLNQCLTIPIKAFDPDIEDNMSYSIMQPHHGISVYNTSYTSVTYCPDFNFMGTDTLYLEVCDSLSPVECDQLMIIIYIPGDNSNNSSCPDTLYTCTQAFPGHVVVCVPECQFETGDTIKIATTSFNCAIDYIGDSCIQYTPLPGMVEGIIDTIDIVLCNDAGFCHTVQYFVNIGCVVDAMDNPPYFINPNTGSPLNLLLASASVNNCIEIPIMANDVDPGDMVIYETLLSENASVMWNSSHTALIYCPVFNFSGNDTFHVSICDTITPTQCYGIPVIVTIVDSTDCHDIQLCTGIYPDELSICLETCHITGPIFTVNVSTEIPAAINYPSATCIEFTPLPGYSNDTNTVHITICNISGDCETFVYDIFITNTPCNLIANDDKDTIGALGTVIIPVIENDNAFDAELTLLSDLLPTYGTIIINEDNSITYTLSNNSFNGWDCFSYLLFNSTQCDTAQVCIFIMDIYPPDAHDDYNIILCCGDTTFSFIANDDSVLGPFNFIIIESFNNPSVVINADGTVTYYSSIDGPLMDTAIYVICNEGTYCDTAYIFIQIINQNIAPQIVDQNGDEHDTLYYAFEINTEHHICLSVIDEEPNLSLDFITNPDNNLIQFDTLDCYNYIPIEGLVNDTIVAVSCDGFGLCDSVFLIIVNITTSHTCIANNDYYTTTNDVPISFTITENDSCFINHSEVIIINFPGHGSITSADSIITYSPYMGFVGLDTIIYIICDTSEINSTCDTAYVFLVVNNADPLDCNDEVYNNAITPNADGINDYFILPCAIELTNNRLIIYNRWGQIVYTMDNYNNSWSGLYTGKNKLLPDGTYYFIFFSDKNKPTNENTTSGFIYLQR